jgi:hypothetical protein
VKRGETRRTRGGGDGDGCCAGIRRASGRPSYFLLGRDSKLGKTNVWATRCNENTVVGVCPDSSSRQFHNNFVIEVVTLAG